MQFNSIQFIFYFLPLFLLLYYLTPKPHRTVTLTLGSVFFYWAAGGYSLAGLGILLALMLFTWLAGRALQNSFKKLPRVLAIGVLVGTLAFFKLFKGGAYLPVGLSFFVFQMIAYLAEVSRFRMTAEEDLARFGVQVAMFPKILMGPMADPRELRLQSHRPHRSLYTFHMGLQEFILGLGLKVLLADRLGGIWAQAGIVGYESISTPFAWLALLSFSMRLYFDFYGYSLMALGLGHMLGYHLPMNFLEPYSAKTVSEFYRRWHATLGRWFREYVYIPLGGNRRGTWRTILNLAAVWLLTGVWHGIGWGYLIWGGILFLLIVNERLWLRKYLERTRILCHFYTVFVILLSWVPFATVDVGSMAVFYGRLFHIGAGLGGGADFAVWGREYAPLLLAGAFFATPIPKWIWMKTRKSPFVDIALFAIFWAAVYFIATSAQDPFMYFQF